jgi:DNA processing protein
VSNSPPLLSPSHPDYPDRLLALSTPPPCVTVDGRLDSARAVAIVGTRKPTEPARAFARTLAERVVRAGGVVVSGGAVGIDTAAHEGALDGGGRTWIVSGTGYGVVYPKGNEALFSRVVSGAGAVVYPFAPGAPAHTGRFIARNGVLVALSDVLVIVQARIPSGALNAARWARRLNRPRWVVCPSPWNAADPDFAGCQSERRHGARALTSVEHFLHALNLSPGDMSGPPQLLLPHSANLPESRVLSTLSESPLHVDLIASRCGLAYADVLTALLTLTLGDVLVEGPEGFFRLASPP